MVRLEGAGRRTLSYFFAEPLLCSGSMVAQKVAPSTALAPGVPEYEQKIENPRFAQNCSGGGRRETARAACGARS
jgi:hypothetical protein